MDWTRLLTIFAMLYREVVSAILRRITMSADYKYSGRCLINGHTMPECQIIYLPRSMSEPSLNW